MTGGAPGFTPGFRMSDPGRFVTADDENLHTGDAWGTPINPYARLAFAKGLHARLGAGADSVLAHLREELLCEQIVGTTVTAVRQMGGGGAGNKYKGEWKDGEPHGQGKFTWPDGGTHEGEFNKGERHGRGKETHANGRIAYEGEWKDNKSHGQGNQTYASGNTYEGEFNKGKRHGQGKMAYTTSYLDPPRLCLLVTRGGRTYEGEWDDNEPQGQGKETWPDGTTYEGEWFDGDKRGQGKETYADGGTCEGEWPGRRDPHEVVHHEHFRKRRRTH